MPSKEGGTGHVSKQLWTPTSKTARYFLQNLSRPMESEHTYLQILTVNFDCQEGNFFSRVQFPSLDFELPMFI